MAGSPSREVFEVGLGENQAIKRALFLGFAFLVKKCLIRILGRSWHKFGDLDRSS